MRHRYHETDVTTASPEELIVKLFEGALRNARQAREHLVQGRMADRGVALSKALAIVGELQGSLDLEAGGEMGQNLDALYRFVSGRLLDANMDARAEPIDDAVGVLATLRDAWREIARGGARGLESV